MAQAIDLIVSGAAIAFVQLPDAATVVGAQACAAVDTDLDVNLWLTETDPTDADEVPSDAVKIGRLRAPLNQTTSFSLAPLGVGVPASAWIIADFQDSGSDHEVVIFVQ